MSEIQFDNGVTIDASEPIKMEYAFPFTDWRDAPVCSGMTLRDYFAAKAMPIALQQHTQACGVITDWHDIGGSLSCVAGDAYRLADAMLRAREVE